MTTTQSTPLPRPLAWTAAALLFAAPASQLVWRGGAGYAFFSLLLLAAATAGLRGGLPGSLAALREHRWFVVGMLAFTLAIPLQWALLGFMLPQQLDGLSRFALALPIFLLLRQLPSRVLTAVGWGCVAGALAVGAMALLQQPSAGWSDATRLNNAFTNAIPFGDDALLLGFLAMFAVGRREGAATLALRLAALAAGTYASYQSGSRGGWIALPALVALLAVEFRWHANRRRLLAGGLVVLACAAVLGATPVVRDRVSDAISDMHAIHHGDASTTSIGARVELWRASVTLFERHPLLGVGRGRLNEALADMARRHELSPDVVNAHAHSDFFSTLAEFGILGPICLGLLYFGMAQPFWRQRHATDPVLRGAAYSGLALVAASVIFGLTIDNLVPVMLDALTALLAVTFLAIVDSRRRELLRDQTRG